MTEDEWRAAVARINDDIAGIIRAQSTEASDARSFLSGALSCYFPLALDFLGPQPRALLLLPLSLFLEPSTSISDWRAFID